MCSHLWAMLCVGWGWVGRHFTSSWGVRTEHSEISIAKGPGGVRTPSDARALVRAVPGTVGANVRLQGGSQELPQLTIPVWRWVIQVEVLPSLITATVSREFTLYQVLFGALEIHFFI